MHIPDSALFIYSMRMFETGFESLYATCKSPYGTHYIGYYPLTYLWMYGALGVIADWFGFDHFLFYGLVTGLGALIYLAVVYAFLRQALPGLANRAFLLFALSGGIGGVAYLVTGVLGLHEHPLFDQAFLRYAMYELFEGPHLMPVTCLPRLYYTLSLALCLGGLTLMIRYSREKGAGQLALALLLLLCGGVINARYGVFSWAIAAIYLWNHSSPMRERIRTAALLVLPVVAAGLVNRAVVQTNPVLVDNVLEVANMAMWFSPFVSVVVLHLFLVPCEIKGRIPQLSRFSRVCACAAIAYLAAFSALFCLYQAYYGNILICRDGAVTATISDWALSGGIAGLLYGLIRRGRPSEPDEHGWLVLWLLAFLSITLSGFGRGWFLRFGPQRLQVFLWLPICMLSALGLQRLETRLPRLAKTLAGALVTCGVCSILVGLLCFQGPLGRANARGPYANLHAEIMSEADARVLDRLGPGRVLALPPASDVIVLQRGNPVVFGIGSFNLTDVRYVVLRAEAQQFFSPDASEAVRRRVIQEWSADYVYCADTWPVAPEVVEQLRGASWLAEVAAEGRATLFKVVD